MTDDFPAAHSMDTRWFAVDEAGHLAVFDSGEEGHVPERTGGDGFAWVEEVCRVLHPEAGEAPLEGDELAFRLGIFFYVYSEAFGVLAPYVRAATAVPLLPLHVDRLPPALRRQAKQVHFRQIDFARHEAVQPVDQFPCVYWYPDWVAYLVGDGKTVRPVPGQEDRFHDFCRELRERHPEQTRNLIFEGPEDDPHARGDD